MKRLVNNSKNAIDNSAPAGSVTTQDKTIVLTELKLIVLTPSTSPIPITAPTNVWVVEIGIPVDDATTMVYRRHLKSFFKNQSLDCSSNTA